MRLELKLTPVGKGAGYMIWVILMGDKKQRRLMLPSCPLQASIYCPESASIGWLSLSLEGESLMVQSISIIDVLALGELSTNGYIT